MKQYLLCLGLGLLSCREVVEPGPLFDVTEVATNRSPLDATPSPDGSAIFFTEATGVFQIIGAQVVAVHEGAPLQEARGLAFSPDAQTLYVADPTADVLFAQTFDGAPLSALADTQGLSPTAIDVQQGVNGDVLFFTGTDPISGDQGIFQKDGASAPSLLFSDPSLVNLDGIAVASSGEIFMADAGQGEVFSLKDNTLTSVASGLQTGSPAGIALTLDEKTLLISVESLVDGHSQVILVELDAQFTSVFDDVIKTNSNSGGLHRAQNADILAWSDSQLGSGGVFRIGRN